MTSVNIKSVGEQIRRRDNGNYYIVTVGSLDGASLKLFIWGADDYYSDGIDSADIIAPVSSLHKEPRDNGLGIMPPWINSSRVARNRL